jgi:hypothetical protein
MLLQDDDRIRTLRRRLREMTESGHEPHQHRDELRTITEEIPNTIRVIDSGLPECGYTCGMFALGFEESEEYAEIAGYGLALVFAGPECFEWFLANHLLVEVARQHVAADDLVMYFSDGRWTHIGRVAGPDRAMSKWGVGLLCEHDFSEVPEQYGDAVRFFRNPGTDASMDLFVRYAKERGIPFEEDN